MKSLVINGTNPLYGEILVSGSKNAALPILFATIITDGVSEIENLPDIGDVRVTLDILRGFGAVVRSEGSSTFIDTSHLRYSPPSTALVSRIRASTYLIGSCLSRFGECRLMDFGGCNFSARPIDLHLSAAASLGATHCENTLLTKGLVGGVIDLAKPSVGATVNAILLAASAMGETAIRGFAREPHIDSLIEFLISAGAEIDRGDDYISIKGRKLHGGRVRIPGDMIEAGTYLALCAVADGDIMVKGCPEDQISSAADALFSMGCDVEFTPDGITAKRVRPHHAELVATPYPGFPTDLQPIFALVLAGLAGGRIRDTVWCSRFGYLDSLARFGVNFARFEGGAEIFPSKFTPASVISPDLRGGMACILAALCAGGESVIRDVQMVERGYEDLCKKLTSIGARVEVFDDQRPNACEKT